MGDIHKILGRKKSIEDADKMMVDDDDEAKRPFSAGAEALLRRFLPTLKGIAESVTS